MSSFYIHRALDKREYLMIIFLNCNNYVVTPHLNRLIKTVQMRSYNIRFYAELTKIIPYYGTSYLESSIHIMVLYLSGYKTGFLFL